jgi:hypothetical protein
MSNRDWLRDLSEDAKLNLRNEITEGLLAVPSQDYLLKLIDDHQDNDKVRTAWNDNFEKWYAIIKKYAKPENDEYVPCQILFSKGFWGRNTTKIDLNAIEKHWRGDRSFSFKNFKFILPVELTGETKLRDFDGATFLSRAYFNGTTFSSWADFDGATFSSVAYFDGATFESVANFYGATFESVANFKDATFSSGANFAGAKFSDMAGFDGATFSSGAYFDGATFSSGAYFKDAKFSCEAGFAGATFESMADFKDAKFSSWAGFDGATFSSGAYFKDASFAYEINFLNSKFLKSPPNFTGVKEFNYLPFFDSGPEALAQQFSTQTCQSSPTGNEEAYRKLKIIAKQHENSELEGFCYRRELLCKYHRLEQQKTDTLIHCGIDAYERLFSCGWSIIKPISLWLFTNIFFVLMYTIAFDIESLKGFLLCVVLFSIALAMYLLKKKLPKFELDTKTIHALKDKVTKFKIGTKKQLFGSLILLMTLYLIAPDTTTFSFKQALPIVSGLDSLGRTYDEIFPQRRMLHPQCGRVEDDGKKSDEESDEEREKKINEAIAKILPQCKIPTALMILAIIHKISSGILIFMFLLALRNNFKMS